MAKSDISRPDKANTQQQGKSARAGSARNGAGAPWDGRSAGDGPALTAESLARSLFGRSYWGERQQDDLRYLSALAEARIAAQRRDWKARHKERMKLLAKEQKRKSEIARKARERVSGIEPDVD